MLRNLHIKNMALIDELEISFEEGLNILTGETGAGKSILLEAMQTALGGKTGREMLREGAEYGLVELLFEISEEELRTALEEMEIPISEEQTLILSRRIYPNRVVNKINDEMVTVGKMKEAAGLLVDIHSQHENQSLQKKINHLHILDRFGHDTLKEQTQQVKLAWNALKAAGEALEYGQMDEEMRKRQMDFAEFEIREIEEAKLYPEEEAALEQRYRKMANSRELMETLNRIYQATGYEAAQSGGSQLGQALSYMEKSVEYDKELDGLLEQLETIDSLLNDFNRELSDYRTGLTFEESEFRETKERLDQIHRLEAKYGKTVPKVLEYLESKKAEYAGYVDYEQRRIALEEAYRQALLKYQTQAETLSECRKHVAKELTGRIVQALKELNFPEVIFEMEFRKLEAPAERGIDDAFFVISTNPGEPVKPLWEVASGGELSRIMLAVKSCLAKEDSIPTLIFDEIDSGISGRTAQKVSERLSALGRKHQVLCISHLPQIAAMADVHYKIEKQVISGKTVTKIEKLDENASVEEIARLLGGVEITETVLSSAAEMKEMAKRTKKY